MVAQKDQPRASTRGRRTYTYFEERRYGRKWFRNKAIVGQFIAEHYLNEGDALILDAGTSIVPIADAIADPEIATPPHLTIMTHNMGVFSTLEPIHPERGQAAALPPERFGEPTEEGRNLFLTGGRYNRELHALFGLQTITSYRDFHPRKVIIGVSALNAEDGLFCQGNTEELEVKRLIFAKPAQHRIVVADYHKIGIPDALLFGEVQKLRNNVQRCTIVTDMPPAGKEHNKDLARFKEHVARLEEIHNIEVVVPHGLEQS